MVHCSALRVTAHKLKKTKNSLDALVELYTHTYSTFSQIHTYKLYRHLYTPILLNK